MSTDFNIKPVGAPVAAPIAQPVSDAAQNAVATVLPASQSVSAVDASARSGNESDVVQVSISNAAANAAAASAASASVSNQVVIDRDAAAVVYQVVDNRTSQVVKQFPEEAVLRRRAYFHTLDLTKDAPTRLRATDRRA
jgi:uncharacterized FlaG/YvyC family protein